MKRILSLAIMAVSGLALTTWTYGQGDTPTIRIGIGTPLTGGTASFGIEMKQAVEFALEEQKTIGALRLERVVADDEASDAKAQTIARAFCDDPAVLGVVGHVNSNVSITASSIYQACGLAMITPMSSNPAVTERGLANVFRLTNRDDHKGPGLAGYLYNKRGKRK